MLKEQENGGGRVCLYWSQREEVVIIPCFEISVEVRWLSKDGIQSRTLWR